MNEGEQRNNERWRNPGNLHGARDPLTRQLPGLSTGQKVASITMVNWGRSPDHLLDWGCDCLGVRETLWDAGEECFGVVQDLLWDVQREEPKVDKRRDQGGLGSHKCGKTEGRGYERGCVSSYLTTHLPVWGVCVYVPPGDTRSASLLAEAGDMEPWQPWPRWAAGFGST